MKNFSHIQEIWEEFEKCKNENDIIEVIGEIPSKFGIFCYEIIDSNSFEITNTYFEYGEQNEDTLAFNFLEEENKNKQIYVLIQSGIWDYEQETDTILVYNNWETAIDKFNELVKLAKEDIRNFVDEEDIEISTRILDKKNAYFSIYELGDYTRTHCDISLKLENILE